MSQVIYLRCGKLVAWFTPDEDAAIERLRVSGMSLGRVARAVSRGKSAVQMRLNALARKAEEAA